MDPFVEDWSVRAILEAARLSAEDITVDDKEKRARRSSIRSLLLDIQIIDEFGRSDISQLATSLLETGFRIGMAAQQNDNAKATVRRLRSKAGKVSADRRLRSAEEGWRRHATELAVGCRGRKPKISQADLAVDILAGWKEAGFVPGHQSVLDHVKRIERSGALSKRAR